MCCYFKFCYQNLEWSSVWLKGCVYGANRIEGIMPGVLASSVIDCEFKPPSGQTKDYKIGICCFSTKHTALRSESNNCLALNQDNAPEWSDMFTCGLLLQWAFTIKSN